VRIFLFAAFAIAIIGLILCVPKPTGPAKTNIFVGKMNEGKLSATFMAPGPSWFSGIGVTGDSFDALKASSFSVRIVFPDGRVASVKDRKLSPCSWFPKRPCYYVSLLGGWPGPSKMFGEDSVYRVEIQTSGYKGQQISVWARFVDDRLFK
jgi:hypothetical protein